MDILISRSDNGFKTSVNHKPTFSGVYSNFNSFNYDQYKIGLIFTLLFRLFSSVSDFSRFHTEVSHLKEILRKNAFPIKLVDNCIKTFFWIKCFCILPSYWLLRKKNCLLSYRILVNYHISCYNNRRVLTKKLPFCKIKVIFKSQHVLVNFSVLKIKYFLTYALMLFTYSRVADAMLPIMAKHADV